VFLFPFLFCCSGSPHRALRSRTLAARRAVWNALASAASSSVISLILATLFFPSSCQSFIYAAPPAGWCRSGGIGMATGTYPSGKTSPYPYPQWEKSPTTHTHHPPRVSKSPTPTTHRVAGF
jgi:hypothetical protein